MYACANLNALAEKLSKHIAKNPADKEKIEASLFIPTKSGRTASLLLSKRATRRQQNRGERHVAKKGHHFLPIVMSGVR